MKNDSFSGFHPVVNLSFFAAVLTMTMFIMQPIYLLISLFGACTYLLYLQGRRGMLRQIGYVLPILLLMAIMNPVFNHEGTTILWYFPNDNPLTLEAIAYGLAAAVMMAASIVWFNCCNMVFTSDKIIYLFGRIAPSMSLLISMTLRFVPRFKTFLQNVLFVQRAMHKPENNRQKLQQAMSSFSATVSWAMEHSIVSADSMKSRGYGTTGRTAYSIYHFEKRDGIVLAVLSLLLIGALVPHLKGWIKWEYYPSLTGTLTEPLQIFAYLCYSGVCLIPLSINFMEDYKWNSLKSKI